jgi:hypothetical protein
MQAFFTQKILAGLQRMVSRQCSILSLKHAGLGVSKQVSCGLQSVY